MLRVLALLTGLVLITSACATDSATVVTSGSAELSLAGIQMEVHETPG